MADKNMENKALSDDELEGVSGGRQAQPLVLKGDKPKAGKTLQKGKAGKAGDLVYRDEKSDFDGKLLSGGIDGSRYC